MLTITADTTSWMSSLLNPKGRSIDGTFGNIKTFDRTITWCSILFYCLKSDEEFIEMEEFDSNSLNINSYEEEVDSSDLQFTAFNDSILHYIRFYVGAGPWTKSCNQMLISNEADCSTLKPYSLWLF